MARQSLTGKAVGGLVGILIGVAWWAIKMPLKSTRSVVTGGLALASEEFKRWVGLMTGGVILLAVSWVALKLFAWAPPIIWTMLVLDLVWVYFVFVSLHQTLENRVSKVRAKQLYRDVNRKLDELPGQLAGQARTVQARLSDGGAAVVEHLRRAAATDPGNKDLQRMLKEAEAEYDWYQPGVSFEPIVPGVGKARRWTVDRGRRFGGGFREGWRWRR